MIIFMEGEMDMAENTGEKQEKQEKPLKAYVFHDDIAGSHTVCVVARSKKKAREILRRDYGCRMPLQKVVKKPGIACILETRDDEPWTM